MYIRTKNGIFRAVDLHNDGHYVGLWNSEVKILAKSETLEELCDCFVTKGIRHIVWDKQRNKNITFEQVKFSFASKDFKLYGAIWTNTGLIYVAKMNEKGELCLL